MRQIRVLVAKPGLDGHDRGAKVIIMGLRDAGMEVIYTGYRQTPEMVARIAGDEDVDVIGLSFHSSVYRVFVPRLLTILKERQLDSLVIAGGTIPKEDESWILGQGVAAFFGPGTTMDQIVGWIKPQIGARKGS